VRALAVTPKPAAAVAEAPKAKPMVTAAKVFELPAARKDDVEEVGAKSSNGEAKPAAKTAAQPMLVYSSKKDRGEAFKRLLDDKKIHPDTKWEDAMKSIINDERYKALKTVGERKAAYTEWCEKRRKHLKEQAMMERRRAREEFMAMLAERDEITVNMSFKRAVPYIERDARFLAIESERERENLFEDYMVDLDRRCRENKKLMRKENMAAFRQLLEETKSIKVTSQWRKVQELLDEDPRYLALDKEDRLVVFDDYIKEMERREAEDRIREAEERKKQERRVRDEFRAMLQGAYEAGQLSHRTKWRKVLESPLRNHAAFTAMEKQGREKELFDDFILELENGIREDKKVIKEIMQELAFAITLSTTLEEFTTAIKVDPRFETLKLTSVRAIYDDLQDKLESKEKEAKKVRQKLVERLKEYLRGLPDLNENSIYDSNLGLLQQCPAFVELEEDDRRNVFEEYTDKIRRRKEKERGEREREKEKEERERREKERTREREPEDRRKDKKRPKAESDPKAAKKRKVDDDDDAESVDSEPRERARGRRAPVDDDDNDEDEVDEAPPPKRRRDRDSSAELVVITLHAV